MKNADGDVVLQVRLLEDRVQLAGEWWWRKSDGNIVGQRIGRFWYRCPDGKDHCAFFQDLSPSSDPDQPRIEPIFEYPSELHFGKLRDTFPRIEASPFDKQKGLSVITPLTLILQYDPVKHTVNMESVIGDDPVRLGPPPERLIMVAIALYGALILMCPLSLLILRVSGVAVV